MREEEEMGELKDESVEVDNKSLAGELEGVRETKGAEELKREEDERVMRMRRRVDGLRVCPECGMPVRGVIWGNGERRIWVGCDRTEKCYRHIVMKGYGWSFEEVCDEWERRNGFIGRMLKWVKWVWSCLFGEERKRERKAREIERVREEKRRKGEEERKRVFGDYGVRLGLVKRVWRGVKGFVGMMWDDWGWKGRKGHPRG